MQPVQAQGHDTQGAFSTSHGLGLPTVGFSSTLSAHGGACPWEGLSVQTEEAPGDLRRRPTPARAAGPGAPPGKQPRHEGGRGEGGRWKGVFLHRVSMRGGTQHGSSV